MLTWLTIAKLLTPAVTATVALMGLLPDVKSGGIVLFPTRTPILTENEVSYEKTCISM